MFQFAWQSERAPVALWCVHTNTTEGQSICARLMLLADQENRRHLLIWSSGELHHYLARRANDSSFSTSHREKVNQMGGAKWPELASGGSQIEILIYVMPNS